LPCPTPKKFSSLWQREIWHRETKKEALARDRTGDHSQTVCRSLTLREYVNHSTTRAPWSTCSLKDDVGLCHLSACSAALYVLCEWLPASCLRTQSSRAKKGSTCKKLGPKVDRTPDLGKWTSSVPRSPSWAIGPLKVRSTLLQAWYTATLALGILLQDWF
jgi:hypothetical protein